MRQATCSKILIALTLATVNSIVGCGSGERHTFAVSQELPEEEQEVSVLSQEWHGAMLVEVLSDPRVQLYQGMFASRSLPAQVTSSFTVQGKTRDAAEATATILVFLGPDSSTAGMIAYLRRGTDRLVHACIARTDGSHPVSDGTSVTVTEYTLFNDARKPFAATASPDSVEGGKRGGYWDCVGTGAVAGTLACTVKCLPAGPLYADCLVGCAGWSILSALVGCAFAQLL